MTDILFAMLAFALMISVIVVIHELGHYWAGRMFGLIGTTFSLGFGPAVASVRDRRGTEWRFSPILLGGYVSFPGDDPKKPVGDDVLTLDRLPRWKRAVVVGAGPGINLVLAALIFALIAGIWGYPVGRPIVQTVQEGSSAASIGLRPGDALTSIGGHRIITGMDVTKAVALTPGRSVDVSWKRGNDAMSATTTIGSRQIVDEDGGKATLGVLGVVLPQEWRRATDPIDALTQGVSDGVFMTWAQLETMKQVFTGQRSLTEMSGPVRIAKASARTLSIGALPFLYLMAMISIAVGVMNLLPIPALDGGHLATYAVEGIARRDLPKKAKERMLRFGFLAILSLGVLAITLDVIALS
jgi:regulator of sigma E protease